MKLRSLVSGVGVLVLAIVASIPFSDGRPHTHGHHHNGINHVARSGSNLFNGPKLESCSMPSHILQVVAYCADDVRTVSDNVTSSVLVSSSVDRHSSK